MSKGLEPHGEAREELLDELLRAAAAEPEPLPPGLVEDAERFIVKRCRRRRRALEGLAAAAAVALLVSGWWAMRALDPTVPGAASPRPAPVAAPAALQHIDEVTVSTGPGTIAVPMPCGNPRVTIYWLYAAAGPGQPERR